jgi:hypothetical protein
MSQTWYKDFENRVKKLFSKGYNPSTEKRIFRSEEEIRRNKETDEKDILKSL